MATPEDRDEGVVLRLHAGATDDAADAPRPRLAHGTADDLDVEAAVAKNDLKAALTLLMDRYGEQIYRYALAMTHDAWLAEDVRQQVFVEAYRDLQRFAGRSSLRTWLFAIARNRCLDATKARRLWLLRFKNEPPAEDMELDDREPDRELDRDAIARILVGCLRQLAPAACEAVLLRYQQELSYEEAGQLMGERAGTLQQRVARALPVLRKCVEARLRSNR